MTQGGFLHGLGPQQTPVALKREATSDYFGRLKYIYKFDIEVYIFRLSIKSWIPPTQTVKPASKDVNHLFIPFGACADSRYVVFITGTLGYSIHGATK